MFDQLKNWEMLSQVWFVHDYVQLQFHCGHTINVYNPFTVTSNDVQYKQGQFGYADSLVAMINSRIIGVSYQQHGHLSLIFSCGSAFKINLSKGLVNFPEAFELGLDNGSHIEFNT